MEDGKTDLKVPPLKIVIPQGSAGEQDAGAARNGKSNSQRAHQALPYVVASSNSDADKENGSGNQSPGESAKTDEKKEASAPPNVDEQVGYSDKNHDIKKLCSTTSGQKMRETNKCLNGKC